MRFPIQVKIFILNQAQVSLQLCHIEGLVQERHNSIANTLELRLSCTKTFSSNIKMNMLGLLDFYDI